MDKVPALFEGHNLRRMWHDDQWWYAIVDLIAALTETPDPLGEWHKLKRKLQRQGMDISLIRVLPLPGEGGSLDNTDCADMKTVFRIIQSMPSPRAELFKQRLAQMGSERLDQAWDPEAAYVRLRQRHPVASHGGMRRMELALSTFANTLSAALHDERGSEGYAEIHRDVVDAGQLAGNLRQQVEAITGKPIVSSRNLAIEKDGGLWGLIDADDSL